VREVAGTGERYNQLDTRYIVPYRMRSDTIEILRVFHTSRRLPQSPPRHRLDRQPK